MQPTFALGDLAMDPVDPLPYLSTTALLDELTPEAIHDLAAELARGSDLALLQLRHGGGALDRVPAGAGARATLPGQVVLYALGVVEDPAMAERVAASLARIDAAIGDHRVGWYPNFVEHPAHTSDFFDEATWAGLQAVKSAYDPDGVFRGNHPVPASHPQVSDR